MNKLLAYLSTSRTYLQPTHNQIIVWLMIVVITLTLAIINIDKYQVGAYWDDASYIVLAKSLVAYEHYGHISNPKEPLLTRYPFGFPLLLAFLLNWGESLKSARLLPLVATLMNSGLLFWGWPYLCDERSHWWSLIVLGITSFTPLVIGHTGMVMSEPLFTTFMLLALIASERATVVQRAWISYSLLGIFLTYAIFIRTVGILLVPAIFLTLIARLKGKSLYIIRVTILSSLVLVTAILMATNIRLTDLFPAIYLQQAKAPATWGMNAPTALAPRFLAGTQAYVQYHVRETIFPFGGGDKEIALGKTIGVSNLPVLVGTTVTLIVILGILWSIRYKVGFSPTIFMFEVIYILMMFIWPWRGARFLYPLQAVLVYQFLRGVAALLILIFSAARVKQPRILQKSLIGSFVALLLVLDISKSYNLDDSRLHLRDLEIGTSWLKQNADATSVILARNPDSIYLYANRKTIDYPAIDTKLQLLNFLHLNEIDYILLAPALEWRNDGQLVYDNYTEHTFIPLVRDLQNDGKLTSVFHQERDMVEVFQVVR